MSSQGPESSHGTRSVNQMWDDIVQSQYNHVQTSVKELLPLDPSILEGVKSLSYDSALGVPIDFAYNLSQYWRTHQSNLLTDQKKKDCLEIRTKHVMNNVARYCTFGVNNFDIPRENAVLLYGTVRRIDIFTKFLMVLIEGGRKKDCIWTNISSLRKFDVFLTQMKFFTKSSEFEDNVAEAKSLIHPVVKFQSDRLSAKRNEKAEMITKYSPQEYSLLVSGNELDQISSMIVGKNMDEIEDLNPVLALTLGLAFLIFVVFNSSRTSDATTISVRAICHAINEFKSSDSEDDFLIIRGPLQTKNSHRTFTKTKDITGSLLSAPLVIWPVHKLFFLENVLQIIHNVKRHLQAKGLQIDEDSFFINENGLPCSSKELSVFMTTACQVVGVKRIKPTEWRSYVETMAKEVQLKNCLQSPESSFSKYQMESVSRHQDHTEEIAERHYRMKTSNCSQIVGQFVSSLVQAKASKKRPGSPVSSSPKRIKLDSEANKIVERASEFMASCHGRGKKKFELHIQSSCDNMKVKYSPPPLVAEPQKERKIRLRRNKRRVTVAQKKLEASSDDSEDSSKPFSQTKPCQNKEMLHNELLQNEMSQNRDTSPNEDLSQYEVGMSQVKASSQGSSQAEVSSQDGPEKMINACPNASRDEPKLGGKFTKSDTKSGIAVANISFDPFSIKEHHLSWIGESTQCFQKEIEAAQKQENLKDLLGCKEPPMEKTSSKPDIITVDVSSNLAKATSSKIKGSGTNPISTIDK